MVFVFSGTSLCLPSPRPPWVTPWWDGTWGTNEHRALHLSGDKGTSSQEHLFREPLVPKCLCRKAWKSDFPSACLNPRFIYIRRKSRTFWGFPEVIPVAPAWRHSYVQALCRRLQNFRIRPQSPSPIKNWIWRETKQSIIWPSDFVPMLSHQSPLLMFLFCKLSCCQEGIQPLWQQLRRSS